MTVTLRDFDPQDIAFLTVLLNSTNPDEPMTEDQIRHWEQTYPANNPRIRRVAESDAGEPVGYGECQLPFWSDTVDNYAVFAAVLPEWQHQGIGQALLAAVVPFAVAQGAVRVRTECKEDSQSTVRFLEQAGFKQIGIRFESALDVAAFDPAPFMPTINRAAARYEIITLADARQTDPEADRHLYEVFAATIVDVPFPGEERAKPDYDNFRADTLDAPNSDPHAIFIGRQDGRMVGMTSLMLLSNGVAITGMTGVLQAHRGSGLATALKVASLRYLKEHGYHEARTHNDTANPPILALNEKLGYRSLPGWLAWEKVLGES